MKIAVIIPTYNAEKFIQQTLNSVLNQTVAPDEIIVIDDGSTDQTIYQVQKFNCTLLTQENKGAASARNLGIKHSKSDWIAFLDSDDLWEKTRIEKLKAHLVTNSTVDIIANNEFEGPLGGPYIKKNLHLYFDKSKPLFYQLWRGCFLSTSAVAVKRDKILTIGGMDEKLRSAQDYDLWLRLAKAGAQLDFINEYLSYYIIRKGSITTAHWNRYNCLIQIYKKYAGEISFSQKTKKYLLIHYEIALSIKENKRYWDLFKLIIQSLKNF